MPDFQVHALGSDILHRKRKVRVWLPDQAALDATTRFPVVYQQDGQLAFTERDAELPFGSWRIDWWMQKLVAADAIRPAIVVGIDNSAARAREYFPLSREYQTYTQFLLEELVPWVDSEYPTLAEPRGRVLMGSSLGGLVAFGLAFENPQIFSACASLSPWFEYHEYQYIHEVLRKATDKPPIRVYMDSGIRDWRELDDSYRGMLLARKECLRLGFAEGTDFDWTVDTWFPAMEDLEDSHVRRDQWDRARTDQHNEFQWSRRLERPLRFLLQ